MKWPSGLNVAVVEWSASTHASDLDLLRDEEMQMGSGESESPGGKGRRG